MSFGEKAIQVLKTIAPTLATAAGGPLAGYAVSAITAALGTPPGDQKAMDAALVAASPETLTALRKADQDFAVRMKELDISEEQLAYADTANARQREVALHDFTPAVLAYGITAGFFGTLIFMLINGKPATGGDALLVMLGSLGTAWAGVVAYYFGSSTGSARKDATISQIAKG